MNEESWLYKAAIGLAVFFVAVSLLAMTGGLLACYRGDPECRGPFASHK